MMINYRIKIASLLPALLIFGALNLHAEKETQTQFKLEAKIVTVAESSPAYRKNISGNLSEDALTKLARVKGVAVLCSPTIFTGDGQEATIRMQSELQYLVREKGDSFVAKTLPEDESPGVFLTATMNPAGDEKVELNLDLRLNVLTGRKPMDGFTLDAGYPIIESKNIKTTKTLSQGQWVAITKAQPLKDAETGETDNLVIFVRITSVAK